MIMVRVNIFMYMGTIMYGSPIEGHVYFALAQDLPKGPIFSA